MTNLQRKPGAQSKALEDWLLTDPESHFMRFVPGQGPGPDENGTAGANSFSGTAVSPMPSVYKKRKRP